MNTCSNCILDTNDDPKIYFDENGLCNHCKRYVATENLYVFKGEEGEKKYRVLIDEIKAVGKKRKYDCILGLSGGIDSTYLAFLAKKEGLRPLCVHFDNGWNSELAVKNIEKIINKTGFDLYTYVINWEEFRDIQRAYFKANVVDIEAITDHAIFASLYKLAADYSIEYILSGVNIVTESILVYEWIFNKNDHINIKDIHKKFGSVPLKTFPFMDWKRKKYYKYFKKIKKIEILNTILYNKKEVKEIISKEFEWIDYGGKHYESVFTRFYQGHILPVKFGIVKRKAHLSNLICSGQMTRDEALEEMKAPVYPENLFKTDKEFVLKKLGFSDDEFQIYLKTPRREHKEFLYEGSIYSEFKFLKPLKPLGDFIKKKGWINQKLSL